MTGGKYPTQVPTEVAGTVPSLEAGRTDRQIYNPLVQPDMLALRSVGEAARTGQKEVFDTAMMGVLLKTIRDETMIDRFFGDLMKGLDRLGRILFSFYWHQDAFAERYGESDLPEIEDSLRNAFEAVGDILLTLKHKSIDPLPDEGMSPDLSEVANV
jgi:hypothetical protein